MKILHIIDSNGLYGAEIMLLNLMEEQVKMNTGTLLVSMGIIGSGKNQLEESAEERGIRTIPYRMDRGYSIRAALDILSLAETHGADLIHSHGYKSTILLCSLPRFLRKVPLIRTLHGWTTTKAQVSRIGLYDVLDKMLSKRADALVHVNTLNGNPSRGTSRSTVFAVENGIPAIHFEPQTALKRDPDLASLKSSAKIVGTICRLSEEKGLMHLIDALCSLRSKGEPVQAVIVGEGPQRTQLEKKVRDAGLQNKILFLGYRTQAYDYLSLFDVFVLPSLTEGLPIVILEAMQSGTPIVAASVGGIPRVLGGGKFGLLVKPGDPQELADAIRSVITSKDDALAKSCLARNEALSRYSSRRMATEYQNVYDTVLKAWKAGYGK